MYRVARKVAPGESLLINESQILEITIAGTFIFNVYFLK